MPVRKTDLGPLTKISEGGFSVVYRVAQYRMPGDPTTPLADRGAPQLQDDRGGLPPRAAVGSDDRHRSHGQAFQLPRALTA
jgi:hypothetical protein